MLLNNASIDIVVRGHRGDEELNRVHKPTSDNMCNLVERGKYTLFAVKSSITQDLRKMRVEENAVQKSLLKL